MQLTVALDKSSEFTLCLRIPGWAQGRPVPSDLYCFADSKVAAVGLKVNGKAIDSTPKEDGYVHMKRCWKAHDVVQLDLPMPIKRVYAHEKIEADLQATHRPELLGGVTVLEGKALNEAPPPSLPSGRKYLDFSPNMWYNVHQTAQSFEYALTNYGRGGAWQPTLISY